MSVRTAPLRLPDHPGVELRREHEAAENLVVELPDEVALGEHLDAVVNAGQGLDKAVIVDAAHKIGHKPVSDLNVYAREQKLVQVHHARSGKRGKILSKHRKR